jgi:hypothetical protein
MRLPYSPPPGLRSFSATGKWNINSLVKLGLTYRLNGGQDEAGQAEAGLADRGDTIVIVPAIGGAILGGITGGFLLKREW